MLCKAMEHVHGTYINKCAWRWNVSFWGDRFLGWWMKGGVLVEGEDIAVVWSSVCGGGSNRSRSGVVRPGGAWTPEEIGLIHATLSSTSGNSSWACPRRRAATGSYIWACVVVGADDELTTLTIQKKIGGKVCLYTRFPLPISSW